ncbi:hypothetical protein B0H16DRAFT_1731459 [Mycena metata]|uniref:Uncharacterized protein n=1 Tax=Mycena metata TaxID=1033252 RepID=A0AAD7I6K6_9AGAR|nr:hypothetical protein B0H16DRAFT_1731459 [Mycena metata]
MIVHDHLHTLTSKEAPGPKSATLSRRVRTPRTAAVRSSRSRCGHLMLAHGLHPWRVPRPTRAHNAAPQERTHLAPAHPSPHARTRPHVHAQFHTNFPQLGVHAAASHLHIAHTSNRAHLHSVAHDRRSPLPRSPPCRTAHTHPPALS